MSDKALSPNTSSCAAANCTCLSRWPTSSEPTAIEPIAEWGAGGDCVASFDACVLRLNCRAQPGFHREPGGHAKSIQPVEILTIVGGLAAGECLQTAAELHADTHPRREIDVGECRWRFLCRWRRLRHLLPAGIETKESGERTRLLRAFSAAVLSTRCQRVFSEF